MPTTASPRSELNSLVEMMSNPVPADVLGALADLGIEVLRETVKDDCIEALARCPMHVARMGKEDRHPSFWVNSESGAFICFSCQYQGNFTQLVADGLDLTFMDAKRWIVTRRRGTKRASERREPKYVVEEREYRGFGTPPPEALESRRISALAAEAYGVKWNDNAWILPILSPSGDLMGWQEKRGRWFCNRPDEVKKGATLFGAHIFTPGSVAILTESPLCSVRIGSIGIPGAMASFGVHVTDAQMRFIQTSASSLILALDNPFKDEAGRKMTELLYRRWSALGLRVKCFNYSGMAGKDPGELSDAEIERGIETACGLRSLKYVHR